MKLQTIDAVGSLATPDGRYEAIRWTHRDRSAGWSIHGPGIAEHVRTKAEAAARLRELARRNA